MVAVNSETGPALFSLESLKASLTFASLSALNEDFFSSLLSQLKFESAKRLDRAVNWIGKITPIKLGDFELGVSSHPYEMLVLDEVETDLSNIDSYTRVQFSKLLQCLSKLNL